MLPRRRALHRLGQNVACFGEAARARERVRVAGRELATIAGAPVGSLEPRYRVCRSTEGHVEQMSKIVRVPRVLRRA